MVAWKTEMNTTDEPIVLIASQDADSASTWEKLFLQKGCSVVREVSPRHTLQSTLLLSPSLIILNLDLPHAERLELCRRLRSATNGTILVVTSIKDEQEIYEYYLAGVDEHLATPLNPMFLLIKSMAWLVKQDWADLQIQSGRVYR
jgi:DNA-binding response OmpR family regulator